MPSFALIGAARGVGLELVRQLSANADNTVIVTVRNIEKSTHIRELQQSRNGNIHIVEADVIDQHTMDRAAAEAAKVTGGSLDVLIHNAARMEKENMIKGFLDYETPEKLDAELIASFNVNVLGAIHAINAFLPLLRKGTTKKILVMGTEGGDIGMVRKSRMSNSVAYGVTKAAEHMVATKFAAELESDGFTVVSISPGFVDVSGTAVEPMPGTTEESKPIVEKIMKGIFSAYPKAAMISPEESGRRLLSFLESMGPAENGTFVRSPEFRD
ncbi:NAD(P)-binding protein [Daedalea quercina L-15889]|uniref:NAD(P)-binding protein n=1 Tax=Daedalea quercina L-15889 TaxID=1314783 RepID=A0A165NBV4_9APHY|nr:NAD(P)-binding protein [Daedalea quercina L-15889]